MVKSNYNLNYNCDDMTKDKGYFCSDSQDYNIQANNINNNMKIINIIAIILIIKIIADINIY